MGLRARLRAWSRPRRPRAAAVGSTTTTTTTTTATGALSRGGASGPAHILVDDEYYFGSDCERAEKDPRAPPPPAPPPAAAAAAALLPSKGPPPPAADVRYRSVPGRLRLEVERRGREQRASAAPGPDPRVAAAVAATPPERRRRVAKGRRRKKRLPPPPSPLPPVVAPSPAPSPAPEARALLAGTGKGGARFAGRKEVVLRSGLGGDAEMRRDSGREEEGEGERDNEREYGREDVWEDGRDAQIAEPIVQTRVKARWRAEQNGEMEGQTKQESQKKRESLENQKEINKRRKHLENTIENEPEIENELKIEEKRRDGMGNDDLDHQTGNIRDEGNLQAERFDRKSWTRGDETHQGIVSVSSQDRIPGRVDSSSTKNGFSQTRTNHRTQEALMTDQTRNLFETTYEEALRKESQPSQRGLRQLVTLLKEHQMNPIVVKNCAFTIAALSEHDPITRKLVGQFGGVDVVLMAMAHHRLNVDVADQCIHLLRNLLKDSPENQETFEQAAGIERLAELAALPLFREKPSIAANALESITFVHLGDKAAAERQREQNAERASAHRLNPYIFTAITRAMALHQENETVQLLGLDALSVLLAQIKPGLLSRRTLAEACDAVNNCVNRFRDSVRHRHTIMRKALSALCDIDEADGGIVEHNIDSFYLAFESVMQREENSDESVNLIERGVVTATNGVWRSPSAREKSIAAGSLEICLTILKKYPAKLRLFDRTIGFLKLLLEAPSAAQRLEDASGLDILLAVCENVCAHQRAEQGTSLVASSMR